MDGHDVDSVKTSRRAKHINQNVVEFKSYSPHKQTHTPHPLLYLDH